MPSMKLRNVESSILLQHAHVPKGEDEEGETNEKILEDWFMCQLAQSSTKNSPIETKRNVVQLEFSTGLIDKKS